MELRAHDLCVGYGPIEVVHGASVTVRGGEIVALIGGNGAGKTTTLRAISGLMKPRSGEVWIDDHRVDGWPAHRVVGLGVAHVAEGRRLFSKLTVTQNLRLGAWCRNARRCDDDLRRVEDLFPILRTRREQRVGTMSGGEQQMVAIARALMSRPEIVMLDEPSLGLAPSIVAMLLDMVVRLKDEGLGVLIVEQKIGEVLAIADRGYVVQNGRITEEGSAAALRASASVREAYLGM
jgi:branched-chain amino acid transport system ATP-binding protein